MNIKQTILLVCANGIGIVSIGVCVILLYMEQ